MLDKCRSKTNGQGHQLVSYLQKLATVLGPEIGMDVPSCHLVADY